MMHVLSFSSVVSVGIMAASCVACATGGNDSQGDAAVYDGGLDEIIGTAEPVFPADTLTDWVSFAEQVSAVRVLSESEEEEAANENPTEGYAARLIELRIDETVWHRPEYTPQDGTLVLATLGWQANRGHKRAIVVRDAPRLEVGGRYVVAISKLKDYWIPLTGGSAFAVAGDRVAIADVAAHGNSDVARSLSEMQNAEIEALLKATEPYPAAAADWSLLPYDRLRAVRLAQNPPPSP